MGICNNYVRHVEDRFSRQRNRIRRAERRVYEGGPFSFICAYRVRRISFVFQRMLPSPCFINLSAVAFHVPHVRVLSKG